MLDRLRRISSRNLYSARALNAAFGRLGSRAYPNAALQSETIDPVMDVAQLREIRDRIARDAVEIKYPDRIKSNNRMYGIKDALFGDAESKPALPAIEHGLFLGDFIIPEDTVQTAAPSVVTFGEYRRAAIHRRQQLPVFTVGPYIHYAEPHLAPAELRAEKARLGRTLLVYLTHSTHDSTVDRGTGSDRYRWLETLSTEYDTVIISAFWWDLLHPDVKLLTDMGFRIAACGLMHDRKFLSRQKTLLRLADAAVGDGIGTHIGYCLAEGVPFTLVDTPTRLQQQHAHSGDVITDLRRRFSAPASEIGELREETDHLWGYSSVRTREQLRTIAQISDDLLRVSRGRVSCYLESGIRMLKKYEGDGRVEHAAILRGALPPHA